jgi:hypothetical protein
VTAPLLASVVVAVVRAAVALADARRRAGGWPWWRTGAVGAVVGYDVLVGLALAGLLIGLPAALMPGTGRPDLLAAGGALAAVIVSGGLVHRRRGLPLAAMLRRRAVSADGLPTLRDRLLQRVDRAASRAVGRWVARRLDRCRRRAGATDEQLLPAVWTPARVRLRETPGAGRTEVALLLLQAQAVVDDSAPPRERLLTLLHLVHDRAGARGVRAVLDQAGRSSLRRPMAPWNAAVPPVAGDLPGEKAAAG